MRTVVLQNQRSAGQMQTQSYAVQFSAILFKCSQNQSNCSPNAQVQRSAAYHVPEVREHVLDGVLDGGARERPPIVRLQGQGRLEDARLGVLDGLRLVQHDAVPLDLFI